MSISTIIEKLPPELRPIFAELVDAMNKQFDERYAVRRDDFEQLIAVQTRSEQRLSRLPSQRPTAPAPHRPGGRS